MRTVSIKINFFTTYRKYAVTRNYKNPLFYSVREKQVSAFSGSREEGAGRREQGGGSREEEAGRSKQGGGSREEEAERRKRGGGSREEEAGRKQGGGSREEGV